MLTVTDKATAHIAKMLEYVDAPDSVIARLALYEGDVVAMEPDRLAPGDTTFTHEGRIVFVIDDTVSELLDGYIMDVEKTDEGPTLSLLFESCPLEMIDDAGKFKARRYRGLSSASVNQ